MILRYFGFLLVILMGITSISTAQNVVPTGFMKIHAIADENPVRTHIAMARFGINGSAHEQVRFSFIGGWVEGQNRQPALINAWADYTINEALTIRAGQFLIPFGIESGQPIPQTHFIDRSEAIRFMNPYRMFRDIGIQLYGKTNELSYALSVVNGNGANAVETDDNKHFVVRLNYGFNAALQAGISGQTGEVDGDQLRRAGAHMVYQESGFLLQSEWIYRHIQNAFDSFGGYATVGYSLTDDMQLLARLDYLNRDLDDSEEYVIGYGLGLSYFFQGRTRFALNYILRDDQTSSTLEHGLTAEFQITF